LGPSILFEVFWRTSLSRHFDFVWSPLPSASLSESYFLHNHGSRSSRIPVLKRPRTRRHSLPTRKKVFRRNVGRYMLLAVEWWGLMYWHLRDRGGGSGKDNVGYANVHNQILERSHILYKTWIEAYLFWNHSKTTKVEYLSHAELI
jgi:hypothetical protein